MSSCCGPLASRSTAGAARIRICAEAISTTSPTRPPATPCSRSSSKLDTYRGESRFTTWAYKFALLEAAVKLRRRAWQGREVPIEPEHWAVLAGSDESPAASAEGHELLGSVAEAIETELSPHQREVLVAIALNGVPIDVLAERLNTTRGALYKTVHDARKKLRAHLAERGLDFGAEPATGGR